MQPTPQHPDRKSSSHRPSDSDDPRCRRRNFAKRKGLILKEDLSSHLSFIANEKKNARSKDQPPRKSPETPDWQTSSAIERPSSRHIFQMKLNRSNRSQLSGVLAKDRKRSLLNQQTFNVDEQVKRYIRGNFEERIQNETVLKAFIDRLVILRK